MSVAQVDGPGAQCRSPVQSRHGHRGYKLLEQAQTALVPEECRARVRANAGPGLDQQRTPPRTDAAVIICQDPPWPSTGALSHRRLWPCCNGWAHKIEGTDKTPSLPYQSDRGGRFLTSCLERLQHRTLSSTTPHVALREKSHRTVGWGRIGGEKTVAGSGLCRGAGGLQLTAQCVVSETRRRKQLLSAAIASWNGRGLRAGCDESNLGVRRPSSLHSSSGTGPQAMRCRGMWTCGLGHCAGHYLSLTQRVAEARVKSPKRKPFQAALYATPLSILVKAA
ncbi:hypothetical protein IWX46DRAFT_584274 [Phyllosticta citricarpa]|uniref:Uncharacterized protein n=1 Tax=Phyllosticta citricarpa TaxID=55181 RepID=A0ABR1LH03_9PEZI